MECVVDLKVLWSLLRKEGWTWKPVKGLQIHSSYLKPGCKIRGGKQGVDFFNGEDALLAHVKAEKDLCARLNLSNIMVRPNAVPLAFTIFGLECPEYRGQETRSYRLETSAEEA
ncbi:hypothetical protein PInf_021414 [Phytophthora infestans]|nr:hypothetical protein PInf_021414 [Phytophthora infestans]